MIIILLFIGSSLTMSMKIRNDVSWILGYNSTANITPFVISDELPNHEYKVKINYKTDKDKIEGHEAVFEGTLEEVNHFLNTATFHVGNDPKQNLSMKVLIEKPNHTEKVEKEFKFIIYHQLPVEQSVFDIKGNESFPLKIAKVLPPFDEISMADSTQIHGSTNFTLEKKNGYIEFEPRGFVAPFLYVFSIVDPSSGLKSQKIELKIHSFTFTRYLKQNYLIFIISFCLIILFFIIIMIQSATEIRKRRIITKKEQTVVVRPAVIVKSLPATVKISSPNRSELREEYQP